MPLPGSITTQVKRVRGTEKVHIIILASFHAPRMKTFGPKCLFLLPNGTSILDDQIKKLNIAFPNNEISVVIGFDAPLILKQDIPNVRFIENQIYFDTNLVEDTRLGLNSILGEQVLIVNCDSYFEVDDLAKIANKSCTLYNPLYNKDGIGVNVESGNIESFQYASKNKWAHITYLCGPALKLFRKICNNADKKLLLHEVLNTLIQRYVLIGIESKVTQINESLSLSEIA